MTATAKRRTIVVGVDGRDGGWEALALAQRLARPDGAELVVVCAYPVLAVAHARLVWPRIDTREDAVTALDLTRGRLDSGIGADLVVAAGSTPGSVLQRIADERGAQLLVLGSSRRAELGRVLGGDVVRQALDQPPCPVAVAPHGLLDSTSPLAHIGVAIDGTPASLAGVRWAGELRGETFAVRTLELIHVAARAPQQPAASAGAAVDHLLDLHRFEAFAALRLAGRLGSCVHVTWTDATGDIAPALAELTPELDLLVIGTHGRGPLGRVLHGGVARDLAQCARCPVVAVPLLRDAEDGQREHAGREERDHGARDDRAAAAGEAVSP